MYERILVPLDGSGRAEHALPYAGWASPSGSTAPSLSSTACPVNDPVIRPLTVYLEKQAEIAEKPAWT